MVEANKQPQDEQHQNPMFEVCNTFTSAFDIKQANLQRRIESLKEFKREVSIDLIDICNKLDSLIQKFKKYGSIEDLKLDGCPVFIQGQDHFIKLLEINSIAILAGLDEEIKTWS